MDEEQRNRLSSYEYGRGAYDTARFQMNDPKLWNNDGWYCSYCGKHIKPYTVYEDRDAEYYFHCNCMNATNEISIRMAMYDTFDKANREESQLWETLPKRDHDMVNERLYNFAIILLKRKYKMLSEKYTIEDLERDQNVLFKKF